MIFHSSSNEARITCFLVFLLPLPYLISFRFFPSSLRGASVSLGQPKEDEHSSALFLPPLCSPQGRIVNGNHRQANRVDGKRGQRAVRTETVMRKVTGSARPIRLTLLPTLSLKKRLRLLRAVASCKHWSVFLGVQWKVLHLYK